MEAVVVDSVALHDCPEYRDGCVEVLCEEWGRSKAARLSMLEKSNPYLPYNIVLLERTISDSEQGTVIGHSRLCRVYGQQDAAFVESVVVRRKRRNQGLGHKLMDETEQHALRLGITTLYLSTHDKQDFYNHIGYEYCNPVVSCGAASAFLTEKLSLLIGCNDASTTLCGSSQKVHEAAPPADLCVPDVDDCPDGQDFSETLSETGSVCQDDADTEPISRPNHLSHPPPPPPPTPLASRAFGGERKEVIKRISVYWMKKDLTSVL